MPTHPKSAGAVYLIRISSPHSLQRTLPIPCANLIVMATVIVPATLRGHLDGSDLLVVEGNTAGDILQRSEQLYPKLKGWILDEKGQLREHVSLFLNGKHADLTSTVTDHDELHIVQAISGGSDGLDGSKPLPAEELKSNGVELLVGTSKGLFVLEGRRGAKLKLTSRHFAGQTVDYACRDSRTGTYYAAVSHGQYGPHLFYSKDLQDEWQEAAGLAFPAESEATLSRIWTIEPGIEENLLWAGVAPAALFRSEDRGQSWTLNRGLWDHPTRPQWEGGLGGLCLHSICPWPGEPSCLAVGISAAGVWITDDHGASWEHGVAGLVPRYIPEEARAKTLTHCVHKMLRTPLDPTQLFMQFHGGVYRSTDAGHSWEDIAKGLPADFGFPLAIDPTEPDRLFVIPLTADSDRVTANARLRVYRSNDSGSSWEALTRGLPQEDAYLTVLRQAFDQDGLNPLGLYFGTKSGTVFGSADGGDSWELLADHLPVIKAVRCSSL